jgi:hypothetical protein
MPEATQKIPTGCRCIDESMQGGLSAGSVNLIYGAFYHNTDPAVLIGSLMDDLSRDRMEVDMIKFSGPAFARVDNRLMSLQLVEQRLTNAVLFSPDGEVLEPAELLHRRPVLLEVQRGSKIFDVTWIPSPVSPDYWIRHEGIYLLASASCSSPPS